MSVLKAVSEYVNYLQDISDASTRKSCLRYPVENRETSFQHQRAVYTVEEGRKYYKIVREGCSHNKSVHSFVVKEAGKFPVGAILKAESWKKPATNFARGNVIERFLPKGDLVQFGL